MSKGTSQALLAAAVLVIAYLIYVRKPCVSSDITFGQDSGMSVAQ